MFGEEDPAGKKKKKKKDKKDGDKLDRGVSVEDTDGFGFGRGVSRESNSGFGAPVSLEFDAPADSGRHSHAAPDFHRSSAPTGGAFDAILAADQEVVSELYREVDKLGDTVRRDQELGRTLQQEVQQHQEERQRWEEEEQRLTATVHAAKARLAALRDEHRHITKPSSLENLSFSTERGRAAEELVFLKSKLEDEEQMIGVLVKGNERFSKHSEEVKEQMKSLEQERKNLTMESNHERELAKRDQRELAELRNKVEQLQRGKAERHYQTQEAQNREQYLRDVKRGAAAAAPAPLPTRPQAAPSTDHSWAQHVMAPVPSNIGPGGTPFGSPVKRALAGPGFDVHF